jgi:hypothetical protein
VRVEGSNPFARSNKIKGLEKKRPKLGTTRVPPEEKSVRYWSVAVARNGVAAHSTWLCSPRLKFAALGVCPSSTGLEVAVE